MLLLPPVDRTEIVYAQSSRGMLERGTAIDFSYEGERFAFRPIGIYWLQAGAGKLLGRGARGTPSPPTACRRCSPASSPCSRRGG